MTKYENIIKKKDDRGPLDLTRQIGELQCEIAGLKTKVHDAELETSLVKAIGINSPEMKAAKAEINTLKETLKSRDYTKQHDYQFLVDENRKLEDERNTQEQCGVTLCVGCDGLYTDQELLEKVI